MEREYADVLIGSGELSRPGYRSPAQSGIIAKITKLVESRISQLKKGTATGQHDAEVDDNLDLFCRAIIEHRQEHVEKGKVAQRKKEVDKQEGEQHREQAFQTFKGNQHVVDVNGDERGSTSKYQAKRETAQGASRLLLLIARPRVLEALLLMKVQSLGFWLQRLSTKRHVHFLNPSELKQREWQLRHRSRQLKHRWL